MLAHCFEKYQLSMNIHALDLENNGYKQRLMNTSKVKKC